MGHAAGVGELARRDAKDLAKGAIDLVRTEAERTCEFGEGERRIGSGGKSGFNFFTDFANQRGCAGIGRLDFRAATPAGAKASAFGCGRVVEEKNVLRLWAFGRARRAAIDFCAADSVDEPGGGRNAALHGVPL